MFSSDVYYDLNFNSFWDFEEAPGQIRDFLLGKKIYKVGFRTGRTEGTIVDVDDRHFFVKCESDDFALPGDSGSLTFLEGGHVVGLVTGKIKGGTYVEVLGIWKFYEILMEWF